MLESLCGSGEPPESTKNIIFDLFTPFHGIFENYSTLVFQNLRL
jgi:hypothetical protein